MNSHLSELVTLANPGDRIVDVVSRMAQGGKKYFGISLVVDKNGVLQGVFNNGDVLRLVARGNDLNDSIESVMVAEPVTVGEDLGDRQVIEHVRKVLRDRTAGRKDLTQYIPVLDAKGVAIDVLDMYELLARAPRQGDSVEVYGLGFVGLTLAAVLSARGHTVTGLDTEVSVVEQLQRGEPHVHEPRLAEMMKQGMHEGFLSFATTPAEKHNRVVIVAVGTPVNDHGVASLDALVMVCRTIGPRLKRGDIVMLRSTVPVGTTRNQVAPALEEYSGLVAGKDFHISFCPERTVEGNAIQELSSLPQIVGGLTETCTEQSMSFWATLTDTVVRVDSLEAAELVKLINNSYRDLSFAFANGLALLADRYNIDASRLIAAANEGYPRDPIPRPSPGVGGYCLTKDPFLYASVDSDGGHGELSRMGRQINGKAGLYPVEILKRFAERVLLVGIAFKGRPETNDLRGSASVDVARSLRAIGCEPECFDAVISARELQGHGLQGVELEQSLAHADAILILNNHEKNVPEGFLAAIGTGRPVLVFDGWKMLDRHEVERYPDPWVI